MNELKETEFGPIAPDWIFLPSTEFCLKVTDGTHDSPKEKSTGKHLITSKHIKGKDVDFENAYLISEDDFNKINERSKVDQWDVIISMIGEYCGFSFVERNEKPDYAVKNVGLFKTGDKNKAFWLYYFLNSKIGRYILETNKSGTSQPYLTLGFLRELPILYPSSDKEAEEIISILSSLDDKIDLLHHQNKTLEQLAETLFRQWFVEQADDSWEEKPLSYFGEIICGKTPSKKIHGYFNGNIPFIKIPDMHGNIFIFNSSDSLTEEGKQSQANKTLPPKSILVSCIATVGLVSMNAIESQTNQQINSIIPSQNFYRYYLFLFMKSSYDFLHSMASGGTATLNLNTGDFSNILFSFPGNEILLAFNKEVEPLFDKIFKNQTQIRTLTQLRDTLLPKLMSGEVRVNI